MPKTTNPLLRRTSSSPFSTAQRTKPGLRKSSSSSLTEKAEATTRLNDTGRVASLVPVNVGQDVLSLVHHIRAHTFDDVPDRAAGMNGERISEVLRFQRALTPVVSLAQLHALSASSTETERELARLLARGVLRKVAIPGRGKGGSAVGEGVVLVEEWKQRLREEVGIEDDVKAKYLALVDAQPTSPTVPVSRFSPPEIQSLVKTGFLTNPAALSAGLADVFRPTGVASGSIAMAGSSFATGTLAAVGGQGAVLESGGGGGGGGAFGSQNRRSSLFLQRETAEMTLSLPSTGAYLKLLTAARAHLLFLLKQLSPRHREATRALLAEKWEGNVLNDAMSRAKRVRGEWSGVLPGKTRRWREFCGLRFEWVLAECVGSGLVEMFDTGSVGAAVRGV